MFNLIFSIAFIALFLLAALIGMLKGKKYVWQFSLSRIIVLLLSVAISLTAAVLIAGPLGTLTVNILQNTILSGDLGGMVGAIESAVDALRAIIAMVIAPLLFIVLMLIIRPILSIFTPLICRLFVKKKKEEPAAAEGDVVAEPTTQKKVKGKALFRSTKFSPVGATLGALCGFLVLVVFFIPLVGVLDVANDAASVIGTPEENIIVEITDAAANNAGSMTVKYLGGKPAYKLLTSYKVMGESASLEKEVEYVADLGGSVALMAKGEPSQDAAVALRNTAVTFEESTIIPMLVSDLLSSAGESWCNDEKFYGIACPSLGEDMDGLVKDFLVIMKDSDYQTVTEDYATIVNAAAVLVENDAISQIKDTDGLMAVLKNEEMISSIMVEFLDNERMSPMVQSITNMGVSLMAKALNVAESADVLYDSFINEMNSAYVTELNSDATQYQKIQNLSKSVEKIYDDHGIAITDGVSTCIAVSMFTNLEDGGAEEVKEFFAPQSGVATVSTSSKSGNALSMIEKIASKITASSTEEQIAKIAKDTFAAIPGMSNVLSDEELDEMANTFASEIYDDVAEGKLNYNDAAFADAKEFAKSSQIVTLEDLQLVPSDITDPTAEAKAIAKVFSSSINMLDSVSGGDFKPEELIKDFGPVLDAASGATTIGSDTAAALFTAIIQSKEVRSSVGWTVTQSTKVANTVTEGAATGEKYETLLNSVGQTIEVIKVTSNNEDATEEINDLMKDLTPASAKTLQELSTPEVIINYGVPEKNAKPASNMLSYMFGSMANAKQNGMPEEEYAKEAAAINDLFSIVMSAKDSQEKDIFGEGSATGITALEFVNKVTGSVVVSDTLVNSAYDKDGNVKMDPLNAEKKINAEQRGELVDALDTRWKAQLASGADDAANAECQKTITAIAAVLNIEIVIEGDTVAEVIAVPYM